MYICYEKEIQSCNLVSLQIYAGTSKLFLQLLTHCERLHK